MGEDKSSVLVGGQTMLTRVAAAMSPVVERIVLLGPDREGWVCWPDSVHVQGPLAGIATALRMTTADLILLVAVDHPFVRTGTLQGLVNMGNDLPVVPVDESGVRQVTCAVYPTSVAGEAEDEARSGGSIQTLLDRISFLPVTPEQWLQWGEDGRSWFSVDTREALQKGEDSYLDR